METSQGSIFYACWMTRGQWELRIDTRHQDTGHRHVHIRRRRNAKGEFSWNEDGTRHDKRRFPVSEAMIGKAKEIAAKELRVPVSSLEFVTGVPSHSRIAIEHDDISLDLMMRVYASPEAVVLASETLLVIIASELDKDAESTDDRILIA